MRAYIYLLLVVGLAGFSVASDSSTLASFEASGNDIGTVTEDADGQTSSTSSPTAVQFKMFYRIDDNEPKSRGVLNLDAYSLKRSSNRVETPTIVDKALTTIHANSTRYTLIINTGSETDRRLLSASVPLCMLQSSMFSEMITVHVDMNGEPFHLDYLVKANDCKLGTDFGKVSHFKTTVSVGRVADAPRPILEQIKMTEDGTEPAAEQSLLQKYW
ncbi:hypothetical protein BSLG_007290 [Batrachochytrium salamandrivorans]|nr:hypothetical protein BSLG_007290 [Batrachochytrium salamandrivorans]